MKGLQGNRKEQAERLGMGMGMRRYVTPVRGTVGRHEEVRYPRKRRHGGGMRRYVTPVRGTMGGHEEVRDPRKRHHGGA